MAAAGTIGANTAVSVLPDVSGVDRIFTYALPAEFGAVEPGTIVRVPLAGRRVRGWVVETGVAPADDLSLRPVERVVSRGPSSDLVELARFASWRYAGRLRPFLVAGSPDRIVPILDAVSSSTVATHVPPSSGGSRLAPGSEEEQLSEVITALLDVDGGLFRLAPTASRHAVVETVISWCGGLRPVGRRRSNVLVLVPERRDVDLLAGLVRRSGRRVAVLPEDWPVAHGGANVVIGTRTAVFGPVDHLGAIVVIDAHAESYTEQRAPTWNAVVIATERARRAGVPCLLTTPCPTPELLIGRAVAALDGVHERGGWPVIDILDRRGDDPRSGLYSPVLAETIRAALAADLRRPVVAVLNRRGRIRLLACGSCGEIARCEHCGAALRQPRRAKPGDAALLTCPDCGESRPVLCAACGSARLKTLRVGVDRAAEEIAALTGIDTGLVSGEQRLASAGLDGKDTTRDEVQDQRILVGTEAVLHRVRAASLVVFLDFDQQLLSARLRSGDQALGLLVLAGRLVGGRRIHGSTPFVRRVVVQTRLPGHEVLVAAQLGDPGRFATAEDALRRNRRLPPYAALAVVSGEGSQEAIETLSAVADLEIGALEPESRSSAVGAPSSRGDDRAGGSGVPRYLIRSPDIDQLCTALSTVSGRGPSVRIEVDPIDI